ncbi:LacI family DNA-binding transcriptional regulator [Ruminiclostridium cellobioparum]|jgi:LacI family transcriptional regulator|uniref:LacI family DNA-binding transcriptional regulator n=1 Tax=Ruminiclostridium cellobioparum TaxID=29355 RepID=UPI0004853D10|nr:LacI family DNA-binding transcriptional regulator [Ruminiclostridium cellobioparum]
MGITTKDLAELCGVSRTTIHRALHNTGRINPETKELILRTASKYDYRPDMLARGLVKGQTYYIGVVILDVDNRYFSQMLNAIVAEAKKNSYFVNITLHEKNKEDEKEQLCRLVDYHVDGIILSSINKGVEYKKFLENLKKPIVTIDNKIAEGIPFVGIDGRKAAADGTQKIIEKGYEKVVFVCPPLADKASENVYVHEMRAKGFQETLAKHPHIEGVLIDSWDYFDLSHGELDIKKRTAFFCTGDMIALDLIQNLKERGKTVVQDYGIMGFDNIDFLRYVSPKLWTISNAVSEVATTAVNLLFDIMNSEAAETEKILNSVVVGGETL